jgi:hypothetical protein
MPRKLVPQRFVAVSFPATTPAESIAAAWQALVGSDAGRAPLERPGSLLNDYFRERTRSPLGKIVAEATRLGEHCRTIVVVAPHEIVLRTQAQLAATAHPHYNWLDLPHRGGRPRVLFVEPTLDNDLLQAALDVVQPLGVPPLDVLSTGDERWGLVVVEPAPSSDERASQFADLCGTAAPLVAALRRETASDEAMRSRVFVLGEADATTTTALPPDTPFTPLAALSAPRYLDGAALFALTAVGADVVTLFKGCVWFHETTKHDPAADHEAVQLVDFLSSGPGEIVVWHHALEPLATVFAAGFDRTLPVVRGYDRAECRRLMAMPDRRRLHLFSDAVRRDRLDVAPLEDFTRFEVSADTIAGPFIPMPEVITQAYAEVQAAEVAAGAASAELRCTRLNDAALGELCALFTTATLIAENVSSQTGTAEENQSCG